MLNNGWTWKSELEAIGNDTIRQITYELIFVFHCKYIYLAPLLRYSASNIGVTFKVGLWIVQGH